MCRTIRRSRRRVTIQTLLLPGRPERPAELRELTLTTDALSDAIGGGLLDDRLRGRVGRQSFTMYVDDSGTGRFSPNDRAIALAARLGIDDLRWLAGLRGDTLVVGYDPITAEDVDVPAPVVAAARELGTLPGPEPSSRPGW